MKRLLKLVSFIMALVMSVCVSQLPVSALKLVNVDYTLPGATIGIDTDGGSPEATAYLDSTVKYSGDYSLKVVSEPSANSRKEFRVSLKMTGLNQNTDYKIAFMMKTQNASGFQLTITNQANWWNLTKVLGKTFDWTPVELEFEYPSTSKTATAVFICFAECEGVWIDDVKLYEKVDGQYVETKNVFENPGFERTGTIEVIRSSASDETQNAEKSEELGKDKAVIVEKAENITIDGNASDWSDYEKIPITTWDPIVEGEVTLAADIRYAYDDEAFYYIIEAQDETHKYVAGGRYWEGDGLQSAYDNNSGTYGVPIGVYYDSDEDRTVFISDNGAAEMENGTSGNPHGECSRVGETTIYEMKVPWSFLGMQRPNKMKFNVIINDNDIGVRKGWLEVAPGIGRTKNNSQYPYMFFGDEGGSVVAVKMKQAEISVGESFSFDVEYSNVTSSEKELEIKYADNTYNAVVKPMAKYTKTFSFEKSENVGGYEQTVTVDDGESIESFVLTGSVIPDDKFAEEFAKTLEVWTAELREIRDKCKARGLSTDYEDADIRLLETYIDTVPQEAERGEYARVAHFWDVLPVIYEECRTSLNAILSGEKKTEDIPKYVTSNIEIRDAAYWATVEKDGIQYQSPITFNGWCTFMSPKDWMHDAKEYGFNQAEVGVYASQLVRYVDGKFEPIPEEERYNRRSDEYAWEHIIEQLDYCEKYGISVSLMMSTMAWLHMGDYGFSDYKTETSHVYNPFNVNHPMVAVQADAVYKEVGKLCDRYECIDNICMLNEPTVKLAGNSYYVDQWAAFLSNRYDGDINKLNKVYGEDSNYTDFSQIAMPTAVIFGLPVYHDYRMFCEDVYGQFLNTLSTAARKYTDLPLCVKEMQRARKHNSDYTLNMATTLEKNLEYVDLAGCDAFYVPSQASTGLGLDTKMLWYDYITSVAEAPVANGEDHVGSDGQGGVENKFYDDISYRASTWQGMIHGGGAQSIWMYIDNERAYTNGAEEFEPQCNLIKLPNSLRDCYINNLDGMRLAKEINALYTEDAKVGIFWSNTSWSYSAKFMNGVYRAYMGTIENGQKVKFVTESTLDHMNQVDLMIIPGSTHTEPKALEAIKKFVERGGKLILLGEDCLGWDDYNQPFDSATVEYIRSNSTVIESDLLAAGGSIVLPENFEDMLTEEFTKAGFMDVVLVDKESGERVDGVEWIHTEYDGKMLINPFNYNMEEPRTVEIWVNGEKAERFTDLKGKKTYYGEITLDSLQPYLIEVGGASDEVFTDISHVSWANEAIYGLQGEGVINGVGNRRFAPDLSVKREELVKMLTASMKSEIKTAEVPFEDVDKSQWYSPFVMTAYANGITEGISQSKFGIGDAVTRQDLAVMAYRAAADAGIISANSNSSADFADSAEISDYAKEAVAELRAAGIINGDQNNCFNPKTHCTRAEAAKIIYNIFYK